MWRRQMCVRLSVRPTVRPTVCPSDRPSVRPSIHTSIRQSDRASVRPNVRPSVHPTFVRPSGRPSDRRQGTTHRLTEQEWCEKRKFISSMLWMYFGNLCDGNKSTGTASDMCSCCKENHTFRPHCVPGARKTTHSGRIVVLV